MRCHRFSAEAIASALDGRPSGEGWVACCPAHDDTTPSLSINETSAGKVLVKCFAGCPQAAVIAALQKRGLWATPRGRTQSIRPDDVAKRRAEREAREAEHRSWAIAIANPSGLRRTRSFLSISTRAAACPCQNARLGFITSLRYCDQATDEIYSPACDGPPDAQRPGPRRHGRQPDLAPLPTDLDRLPLTSRRWRTLLDAPAAPPAFRGS